ncbi:MAG: hypothetical protein JWP89_3382 [Schlesneria sp.]|nr:hypothetical protein [Schlesneria sp.]
MAKRRRSQTIRCKHFTWNVSKRGNIYYADGRHGTTNSGRHSLHARTEEAALKNLHKLDEVKAREVGLIPQHPTIQPPEESKSVISIAEGWEKYTEFCRLPINLGGVSPDTQKRYRAVKDKHLAYCKERNITNWSLFSSEEAEKYGQWLHGKGKATRTIRFEITLLISVVKWLIARKLLDSRFRIHVAQSKPCGTDTYCYTRPQIVRILDHCQQSPLGQWIRPILIALATTGLRIGELIALRWSDIDFQSMTIRIADERHSHLKAVKGRVRTTKGGRSRTVPLNPALKDLLTSLERHPDGTVFHGMNGVKLRDKRVLDVFKTHIREPLKEEFPVPVGEIGFQNGTIHSFRHYFVSEAFRQGAKDAEIMDWVGHRSSEMVAHYRHLRADESQRRMQSIDFIGDDDVSSQA